MGYFDKFKEETVVATSKAGYFSEFKEKPSKEPKETGYFAEFAEATEAPKEPEEEGVGQYISAPRTRTPAADILSALRQSWTTMKMLERGIKPEEMEPGGLPQRLATQTPALPLLAGPVGKTARVATAILPWMTGGLGPALAWGVPLAASHAALERESIPMAVGEEAVAKTIGFKVLPWAFKKFGPAIGEAIGAKEIGKGLQQWATAKKPPIPSKLITAGKYAKIDELKAKILEAPKVEATASKRLIPPPLSQAKVEVAGKYTPVSEVPVARRIPSNELIETTLGELRNMRTKTLSFFDVEYPFRKIGAPQTGIAIKTMVSKKVAGEERALQSIKALNNFKLSPEGYQNVSLLAENPFVATEAPAGEKAAAGFVRKLFDAYAKKLQEAGVLKKPFPQSLISRLGDEINVLKSQRDWLVKGATRVWKKPPTVAWERDLSQLDKLSKTKLLEEISIKIRDNELTIGALKQIKYVHLPVRLWFEAEQKFNPRGFSRALASFRQIKGRKTISLRDLVEQGIVPKDKIDARDIVANYVRYVEGQLAEKSIVDAALKERMAMPLSKAPLDWVEIPTKYVPTLKGYKVHPAFADYLEHYFQSVYRPGADMSRVLASIKMMQFYNPFFLPMYDIVQAGMLGSLTTPKMPVYMWNAVKSFIKKDTKYFTAYENGLFSTPYANPFARFVEYVETLKGRNDSRLMARALQKMGKYKGVKKIVGLPYELVKDLYSVSWNVAWSGDKMIRLMSYNYLMDKGFTSQNAAQTAALFHGDYASVPPATRRMLNHFFFTPTFKIVMTKLYDRMIKEGIKYTVDTAKGKPVSMQNQIYARGVLYTAGINLGKDMMMKKLGFESDQFGRKYYRVEETSEGPKEIAITFTDPSTLIQRYFYRAAPLFDPAETKKMEKAYNIVKYEFHPLYRWAEGLVNPFFERVINPFDSPDEQAYDFFRYTMRNLVRMSELVIRAEEDKLEHEAVRKSEKSLYYMFLNPFTFRYIRDVKEKRKHYAVRMIKNTFKRLLITDPPKTEKERQKRLDKLFKMIEQIKGRYSEQGLKPKEGREKGYFTEFEQ